MPYSDLHCHPFLRPFEQGADETVQMSANTNNPTSVWYMDDSDTNPLQDIIGFIPYTESDFVNTAQLSGGALVLSGLYAVESGFFNIQDGWFSRWVLDNISIAGRKKLGKLFGAWITRYRLARVNNTGMTEYDYFNNLRHQFRFAIQSVARTPVVHTNAKPKKMYDAVRNSSYEITGPGQSAAPVANKIKVVLTVEGGNCLWNRINPGNPNEWNGRNFNLKLSNDRLIAYQAIDGLNYVMQLTPQKIDDAANNLTELIPWNVCTAVLHNVSILKGDVPDPYVTVRPFFMTLAHHFYNGVCGHAQSLQPLQGVVDQKLGMNSDITNLGWMVINELLKDPHKRILIDIKHMSLRSRFSYYAFRKRHYPDVPIVASHMGVYAGHLTSPGYFDITDSNDLDGFLFYKKDINLLDDDIQEIVKSNGIIGLELDKRVNGVVGDRKKSNVKPDMIWNSIRYIVSVISKMSNADVHNKTGWDYVGIGSDFDGVINPHEDSGKTSQMGSLRSFIEVRLTNYLQGPVPPREKNVPVNTILDKLFYKNVSDFVDTYYV